MSDIQSQNMANLAAAFDGREITNAEGEISSDETEFEESALQDTNTVEETASSEKSAEQEVEEPKDSTPDSEPELAEDETGKRYVPESRFSKVYGEKKALERELEAIKSQAQGQTQQQPSTEQPANQVGFTDVETEVLYVAMPQFNPESDQYNRKLDSLGLQIFRANPGITKIEAARRAIRTARELTADSAQVVAEARTIKSQQSDQGITSRVTSRQPKQVDIDSMNDQELEAYLRANGQWDK